MKRAIFSIVFLMFCYFSFIAQTDDVYVGKTTKDSSNTTRKKRNNAWMEKVTYGGNFQAFYNYGAYVYLAPNVGYVPIKNLNIGVGLIYNYVSMNYNGYGRFTQSIFGTHTYARYFFNESFFAQGQFDRLLQPNVYNFNNPEKKVWVDYFLIGGGYRQPLGKHGALVTSIMVNVSPNRLSIYPNPIFQVGFVGGFW